MAVDSNLSSPLGPPACEKDAKALRFIEEMTRNADTVQENLLAEILARNANTEYLRRFNLGGATDRDTFKTKIPVITYEDLQPEIQRIADGDRSPILSSHPISEFLTSSGTSAGERKLMPTIREELDRRQLLYSLLMPVMNLYVPGLDKGKGMYFLFVKSETKTPGGLPARPVLTSYYKSEHFRSRPYDPYNVYTSPNEAILCPDSFQSMYTQMLCGLLDRLSVLRVGAVFASGLLRAIRFLQLHWSRFAHDIELGCLDSEITDPSIRECMSGFHNSAPQFHFVRRKNVLLSIDSDKTDESELQKAVENASKILHEECGSRVAEYTSYADTSTIPGHYVLYWELLVRDGAWQPSHETITRCCLEMEESLNSVYRQSRVADNSVGPLEIRVVRNGTFEELMDYAISRGASINQYKVPRCVNFTPIVELLDSRVVSAHFSPSLPHWTPERRRR
ncbi:unnamed protein product [Arabidopsis arenosa]|uniref:GH3 C-terminal domain-containing protein n=1 Tax=Arabidopsis arenosa TaxID=38785 RepID=A0A8S1ZZI4_ARAAE|nr:unnamed protein product [Arabidopsis arenosa]